MSQNAASVARHAVDLHSHTTHSDGTLTPAELVRLAGARGVRWLAITDHDTISALGPAREAAAAASVEIVPAVEISVTWRRELHLLGYGFDPESPAINELLDGQRDAREARFETILAKLAKRGIRLDKQTVRARAKGTPGRPHIADALVAAGRAPDRRAAFDLFLGNQAWAYVPAAKVRIEDAIQVVHDSGGAAVLAHPGPDDVVRHVPALAELGLDGVECVHPAHSVGVMMDLQSMCRRLDLVPTGGSDFHTPQGTAQPGDYGVDARTLDRLLERAA